MVYLARFIVVSSIAWMFGAVPAFALPVSIDPGDYPGRYSVGPASNVTGPITIDVAAGTLAIVIPGTSNILVDLDATGDLSNVRRPGAATVSGSTLVFNTADVTVDPASYGGRIGIFPAVTQFQSGIQTTTVIKDVLDWTVFIPGTSSIRFDVDTSGMVANVRSSGAATVSGSTITLNTSEISVQPGAYTGAYRILPAIDVNDTGPQTTTIVPDVTDWTVFIPGTGSIRFDVDASGVVSNIRRPGAATSSGSTITLNTAEVSVQPGSYVGTYSILPAADGTSTGPQTETIVPDVTDWTVFIPGTGSIRFDVDASGDVANIRRPGAASSSASTIYLNTSELTVDPGSFTGAYRVLPAELTSSAGVRTVSVVRDVINWQVLPLGSQGFRFAISADGDPSPSFVPLQIGGTIFEFLLTQSFGLPIANAGADQSVNEGDNVFLDGSASSDPQTDPLTFLWSQLAGPNVALSDATVATPSFLAPAVSANETVTLQLVVSDGQNASEPDTVNVTIKDTNTAPVADAGDDLSIKAGADGFLFGANSFDPDGDILSYQWQQVSGPVVAVSDPTVPNPAFEAPGLAGQELIFKLMVSDGALSSIPSPGADSTFDDTVRISTVANMPPIANAGPDQTRVEGALVSLDGGLSNDPDGDLISYLWSQTAGPAITLSDDTSEAPSFIAPLIGTAGVQMAFSLQVSDGDPLNPLSATDETIVSLANVNDPPSCELAVANNKTLWPPNHTLVDIRIIGVEDPDTGIEDVTLNITGVTQDEPVQGTGDGDTSPDAIVRSEGLEFDRALLRAERDGSQNGRVYVINFNASDGQESCQGTVQISVPKKRKNTAVDDGQIYDSTIE